MKEKVMVAKKKKAVKERTDRIEAIRRQSWLETTKEAKKILILSLFSNKSQWHTLKNEQMKAR